MLRAGLEDVRILVGTDQVHQLNVFAADRLGQVGEDAEAGDHLGFVGGVQA